MRIVISSGHAKHCRGASGIIDEVDEARRVVNAVADLLKNAGVTVHVFHDDVSDDQSENLNTIVAFHNNRERDLDISVHFNAYKDTNGPMGTECLFVTQEELASEVATAIAHVSGLKNRGPKERDDLFFLNNTDEPAILIEVCFVDSLADTDLYERNFSEICEAIAETVSGENFVDVVPPGPPPEESLFRVTGKASYFGGPNDDGVSRTEGLAFITSIEQAPHLFLPYQPSGTSGLARRLNPYTHYIACRWDYAKTPKPILLEKVAVVRALDTGIALKAFPADWGPNENTGRVADLSPCLMDDLGIKTDGEVEVTLV
jgi:N-acetylmuramoyl-L-alanine amidase